MINLPPVRPRASYAGVDKDSLAYAVVLNPVAQADPIDTYQTRTKADESTASGTPLKYGARGGETITGNLGRDESGRFARIDEAVARSASLHGGKKPKKATRSAAQVAAAKRETAHAALQAAKIDKAVYDGVTALDDAPVKAGEESDAVKELVKAGYAEEAGGMIVPSALGSRLAKAAESGKPGKVAQVVARESQRTRARAQALDDQIESAQDKVDNARNDRQRAIAQRRLDAAKTQRAALGDVGKSTLKHMPGKHNQSSHGRRGAVGGAFRSAYTAARAGGKTHSEAWNAGKHAAEGVREQMRVEKRAQAAANPKPKRTSATAEPTAIDKAKQDAAKGTYQLPHAHGQMIAPEITEYFRKTPNGTVEKYNELVSQANENMQYYTTHNQEMQRIRQAKTQAEQAQITPEQRARVQELNATPLEYQRLYRRDGSPLDQSREEKELLSAHTSLRMAKTPQEAEQALAKYTDAKARYDQHVDKTLAELPTVQARPFNSTTAAQLRAESGLTRTTQPEAPTPKTQTEGGKIAETLANNVRERRANEARLAQVQQEMQRYTTPDSPYASDHPEYERLRDERATLRARNSTLEAEYDKGLAKMREIDTMQSASLGSPEHQQLQQRVQEMQDRITTGRSNVGRKLSKAEIAESKDLLQKRQSKLDEFERRAGKQSEAPAPTVQSGTTREYPTPKLGQTVSQHLDNLYRHQQEIRDKDILIPREEQLALARAGLPRKTNITPAEQAEYDKAGREIARIEQKIQRGEVKRTDQARKPTKAEIAEQQQKLAEGAQRNIESLPTEYHQQQISRLQQMLDSGTHPKTKKPLTREQRGLAELQIQNSRNELTRRAARLATKAVLSSAQRRKLPGSSFVFPDTRSFPIIDKRDIQKAVHAWGRYQGKYSFEVFKRRLTAIARRMGAVDALPDTWQVKTKAADHDMTPPQDVRDAAKRGLALRRQFGRGGTEVGIARARDLSNGASIPLATINRMVSFFARHAVDKRPDWSNPSNPSNGYIAWLLWGGDAGRRWALAMQKRMTKE